MCWAGAPGWDAGLVLWSRRCSQLPFVVVIIGIQEALVKGEGVVQAPVKGVA